MKRSVALAALIAPALVLGACTTYVQRNSLTDLLVSEWPEQQKGKERKEGEKKAPPGQRARLHGPGIEGAGQPLDWERREFWKPPPPRMRPLLEVGGEMDDPKKFVKMNVIPIPFAATNPNEGAEVGMILPVVISRADQQAISTILAPDITFNELRGLGAHFRILRYYPTGKFWTMEAGGSTNKDYELFAEYRDRDFFESGFYLNAYGRVIQELGPRFYGIGADTREEDETSYTHNRIEARLEIGYPLARNFDVSISDTIRRHVVKSGKVDDVPSIEELFHPVPGVRERHFLHLPGVAATYDSRDTPDLTTQGLYGRLEVQFSQTGAGSDSSFTRTGLDVRGFLPLADKRFVTALRLEGVYNNGKDGDLPFTEMSTLGGRDRLRGYLRGRWTDNHYLSGSLEQRIRAYRREIMEHTVIFELAPFFDYGRVFGRSESFEVHKFRPVPGLGIRMIVPPNIVARIDIGRSSEGTEIFVQLGYPF